MSWDICQDPNFTAEDQRVLRETTITRDGPGTILRDVEALLDHIAAHDVALTPTGSIAIKELGTLNDLLAAPTIHGFKRPQLKSLPALNGLYLLLRASGLTEVEAEGEKGTLRRSEPAYRSWQTLNDTERYGTLLETWFIRGQQEIIGEDRSPFGGLPQNFFNAYDFLRRIPPGGTPLAGERDADLMLHIVRLHNLALLQLFGCITVESGRPRPGKGWEVARVEVTPFGRALLTLLNTAFFADVENTEEIIENKDVPYGYLQPVLVPFFPEWQNYLELPRRPFRPAVHIFTADVGPAQRQIAIAGGRTLDELAYSILAAFAFEDMAHLYQFTYRNPYGAVVEVSHPAPEEGPWTDRVRVGDLPLNVDENMLFVFDFGDWWEFVVHLDAVDETSALEVPEIIGGQGEAPAQYGWDEDGWDDEDDAWDDEMDAPFDG